MLWISYALNGPSRLYIFGNKILWYKDDDKNVRKQLSLLRKIAKENIEWI